MRTIKFRGQRADNNEWVYGGYVLSGQGLYIVPYSECSISLKNEKIISKTFGQFTGLTDKNGKEIYEGDKVVIVSDFKGSVLVVTYFGFSFKFVPDSQSFLAREPKGEELEVVGNIYDSK